MSPKYRPHIVGLAAPGLLWLATSVASGQTPEAPPGPPITTAPTSSTTYRALLLSSGKVVLGEIVEDPGAQSYRLLANGGTVGYPKTMVLKAAGSILELYQFQAGRLPAGDPDERIKLARWCLTEHLPAQAREQLEAVEKMCPGDAEVKRMLYNLASSKVDRPAVDPDLRRTSGEMTRSEAPASLDPRALVKIRRNYNALPVIFDLTQAQAIVRANDFVNYVQPVLLRSCVKCHNEKYEGQFQLVDIKVKRDLNNTDIARANLDAALRLVNPDDPLRSELLSSGLVPHGGSKNAIFRGPNDLPYTYLLTWVKSLRPATPVGKGAAEAGPRAPFGGPDTAPGDNFAADRSGHSPNRARSQPSPVPGGMPPLPGLDFAQQAAASAVRPPAHATVQTFEESAEFITAPGDNPQFPTPFQLPEIPTPRPAPPKPRTGTNPTTPPRGAANPKATTAPGNPNSVMVNPTENPNKLPGMNQALYPNSPNADPATAAETSKADPADKKPKKIDNALMEKMMKIRNGTP